MARSHGKSKTRARACNGHRSDNDANGTYRSTTPLAYTHAHAYVENACSSILSQIAGTTGRHVGCDDSVR